ncbi:hypothetical protein BDF22DRAFT_663197 [Syncephalis plumigaleata]|nr:hypothetical protein BDF22DRAFT_663197 [Syncephalis plumigaleata]
MLYACVRVCVMCARMCARMCLCMCMYVRILACYGNDIGIHPIAGTNDQRIFSLQVFVHTRTNCYTWNGKFKPTAVHE